MKVVLISAVLNLNFISLIEIIKFNIMKKITLSLLLILTAFLSYGQWAGSTGTSGNIYRFGNVGVGTNNPQSIFQVGTGMYFHNGGTQQIGFRFNPDNGSDTDPSRYGGAIRFDPNSGQFSLGVSSSFTNNPSRILVATRTQRVGIRTAIPDATLTVNGDIHAKEVRVDLNIPADYVFEKYYKGTSQLKSDYTMPTLEEVAAYTKENMHLPGIPSAKEIKDEGLHLKKMTNLLLQKVEELTLYTIEQERRIKALEKALEAK